MTNCCIPSNHQTHPEIWLRPSKIVSLSDLSQLVTERKLTATVRQGVRTAEHPKGYAPGQKVMLKICNGENAVISTPVYIKEICSKKLSNLTKKELEETIFYSAGWRSLQQDLSFFEHREIKEDEIVSLVKFNY